MVATTSESQRSISIDRQKDIAIILPAWNEEKTVVQTIVGFHAALPGARIYVIDNNSTDSTAALAREALERHQILGAVLFERRQGKGNAVRRAFLDIDADVFLMADADCTYPPEQAAEIVAPVLAGEYDMVVGDRRSQGDYARENSRPMHEFGNRMVQCLVNLVGRSQMVDIMSGYRAMSKTFVRCYPLLVEGFQIETDLSLYAAQGRFRCREVPVRYIDRPAGSESKLSTVKDGIRVLMTIFQIVRFYRPLTFFSLCSLVLCLLGLLLGLPVIWEYISTSYITRVPTAILASALEILAITIFSAGVIMDALAYQRQMEIENNIKKNTRPKYS